MYGSSECMWPFEEKIKIINVIELTMLRRITCRVTRSDRIGS